MKRTVQILSLAFLSFISVINAQENFQPIGEEAFKILSDFYQYDKDIPLNTRMVETSEMEYCTREKIVFTSVDDERVPGYLAIPKTGLEPYPLVMLLHGFGHEKESWWNGETYCNGTLLTKSLLESGFAVLMLDAQYFGERIGNNDFEHPRVFAVDKKWISRLNHSFVQTIKDYRRAMDYLAGRTEIDTGRIGITGYSMGGIHTFMLSALDSRIKTIVTAVAPPAVLTGMVSQYNMMAVENYAARIEDKPMLMLMGKEDEYYTSVQGQQLYELINNSETKIIWYDSGHSLPPAWTDEALAWFKEHL
ncbi:MAG: alpha/beta fold hydrolase [Bacteroidota bacterium]